jgi:hypothetical protein
MRPPALASRVGGGESSIETLSTSSPSRRPASVDVHPADATDPRRGAASLAGPSTTAAAPATGPAAGRLSHLLGPHLPARAEGTASESVSLATSACQASSLEAAGTHESPNMSIRSPLPSPKPAAAVGPARRAGGGPRGAGGLFERLGLATNRPPPAAPLPPPLLGTPAIRELSDDALGAAAGRAAGALGRSRSEG